MRKLPIATLGVLPWAALAAPPETVPLVVQNMNCEQCQITVKASQEKMPGVSAVKVDFNKGTATITYDADKAPSEALTLATANTGYSSTVQK